MEGSLEPDQEADNHMAVHKQGEDIADQAVTSAGRAALPSLALAQTYRLVCPFLPCAVSACMHKLCNKPYLRNNLVSEMPRKVHRFQQYTQLWKICMQFVLGRP